MAERSTVTQVTQLGVETTSGTAVAAGKRLAGVSIVLNPNISTNSHRPEGYKYSTVQSLGKDYSEGPISGRPTYDELIYPFSMLFGAAVVTTPAVGTDPTARLWTWTPSSTVEDVIKTLTIERGSALRAHRAAYAFIRELTLEGNREGVTLGGSIMAQAIQDGITLTAAPTELPLVPVDPDDVSIYLDTTSAGLGGTKLTRVLKWTWGLGDKANPLWVVDAAQASYVNHVEIVPNLRAELTVEADSAGMAASLANLRTGSTRFLRIEANGALIGSTITYRLRIDQAIKVKSIGSFEDSDGVYAINFTAGGYHDPTWAKAIQIALQNTQTAL